MEVGAMFQLVALCRSVASGLLTSTVELLVAMTWLFTSLLCSSASVSEAECLEAVSGLLPQSQAQGRRNLVAGSWGHVPVGCSVLLLLLFFQHTGPYRSCHRQGNQFFRLRMEGWLSSRRARIARKSVIECACCPHNEKCAFIHYHCITLQDLRV